MISTAVTSIVRNLYDVSACGQHSVRSAFTCVMFGVSLQHLRSGRCPVEACRTEGAEGQQCQRCGACGKATMQTPVPESDNALRMHVHASCMATCLISLMHVLWTCKE